MTRQRNRQLWAQRLKRYQLADQTIADFCRSENISQAAFYYWKKRLGDLKLSSSEEIAA